MDSASPATKIDILISSLSEISDILNKPINWGKVVSSGVIPQNVADTLILLGETINKEVFSISFW